MSKVINKKLHPYYKTGINGWIGEEIDDNDYIICPICGEVLGMNYCDYASEQVCDDKCPKCSQELDYSEIYDFEDTCYFEQLLEIKDHQLAEKEKEITDFELEVGDLRLQNRNLKEQFKCAVQSKNQDKISFAVEQLEKVKEFLAKRKDDYLYLKDEIKAISYNQYVDFVNEVDIFELKVDNQIEELKKEMK